nr:2Fe-2S iron-sulfur cluster binding domain-containing protein [Halovenus rubra]
MPTVTFRDKEIECETGAILRDVLREADLSAHNGRATILNCRGHGSCGTCAVTVSGDVSRHSRREKARLSVPHTTRIPVSVSPVRPGFREMLPSRNIRDFGANTPTSNIRSARKREAFCLSVAAMGFTFLPASFPYGPVDQPSRVG